VEVAPVLAQHLAREPELGLPHLPRHVRPQTRDRLR
jgi:hypothetical protein